MMSENNNFDFIGKIPAKTELTVFSADSAKSLILGLPICEFNGCKILSLSKNPIKNRLGLYPGRKVLAWNGKWKVVLKMESFFKPNLYLENDVSFATVEFKKDERKCWTCPSIINKKVFDKIIKR